MFSVKLLLFHFGISGKYYLFSKWRHKWKLKTFFLILWLIIYVEQWSISCSSYSTIYIFPTYLWGLYWGENRIEIRIEYLDRASKMKEKYLFSILIVSTEVVDLGLCTYHIWRDLSHKNNSGTHSYIILTQPVLVQMEPDF